jgi:hypothetical protein
MLPKNTNFKIYGTVILPIVVYGREPRPLTIREGVWQQGAEENMWTEEGRSGRIVEKNA